MGDSRAVLGCSSVESMVILLVLHIYIALTVLISGGMKHRKSSLDIFREIWPVGKFAILLYVSRGTDRPKSGMATGDRGLAATSVCDLGLARQEGDAWVRGSSTRVLDSARPRHEDRWDNTAFSRAPFAAIIAVNVPLSASTAPS